MEAKRLTKYATHAAAGAAVWQGLFGGNVKTPVGELPSFVVGGALGAFASISTDVIHGYVLPSVSDNEKLTTMESALLAPAAAAGAYLLGAQVINPLLISSAGGWTRLAGIAVGSEIFAEWTYMNFINPTLGDGTVPVF